MIKTTKIEKATKILKRIEPTFHHLEVENGEVRFFKNFFDESQDFGCITSSASWKEIVRKFISLIKWANYMQQQCNQYGCD